MVWILSCEWPTQIAFACYDHNSQGVLGILPKWIKANRNSPYYHSYIIQIIKSCGINIGVPYNFQTICLIFGNLTGDRVKSRSTFNIPIPTKAGISIHSRLRNNKQNMIIFIIKYCGGILQIRFLLTSELISDCSVQGSSLIKIVNPTVLHDDIVHLCSREYPWGLAQSNTIRVAYPPRHHKPNTTHCIWQATLYKNTIICE